MNNKDIISIITIIGGFSVIIAMGIYEEFQLNESLLNIILMAGLSIGGITGTMQYSKKREYDHAVQKLKNTEHSDRAKRNMTIQVLKQLEFLEQNLAEKIAARNRLDRWKKYRLPGLQWMIDRKIMGIARVQSDINRLREHICELQRKKKIYIILNEC